MPEKGMRQWSADDEAPGDIFDIAYYAVEDAIERLTGAGYQVHEAQVSLEGAIKALPSSFILSSFMVQTESLALDRPRAQLESYVQGLIELRGELLKHRERLSRRQRLVGD